MHLAPYYVTISDYAEFGIGHACDPASFDDACDAYVERMEEGAETLVFRCTPPTTSQAGVMEDVTADAASCIRKRMMQRNQDFPAWLEAA